MLTIGRNNESVTYSLVDAKLDYANSVLFGATASNITAPDGVELRGARHHPVYIVETTSRQTQIASLCTNNVSNIL